MKLKKRDFENISLKIFNIISKIIIIFFHISEKNKGYVILVFVKKMFSNFLKNLQVYQLIN